MHFNPLDWFLGKYKKYLDVSEVTPFAVSFRPALKSSRRIPVGGKLQNTLIRVFFRSKTLMPKLVGKIVPLIKLYKQHFVVSDHTHQRILYFLGRSSETKLSDLAGFDRKEYKRYQKLFAKKHTKPVSINIPFVPEMFIMKPGVVNFQETIDFFKSLYIAEEKKKKASS